MTLIQNRKILLSIVATVLFSSAFAQNDLKLWYDKPARNWNEALPVGNGRLGAMVFGKVNEELIQLNEETLWSGGPVNTNPNPGVFQNLPAIREALLKEDYQTAEKLTSKMQGLFTESYEPLGDLIIKQSVEGEPVNYYRDLNISNATSTTRFTVNGVDYSREVFVSAPDQVIIIRLTSSKKNTLTFTANTQSPLYVKNGVISSSEIAMKGQAPAHTDPSYMQT
ncbi:MAG: hypothetical protein C0490_23970, partial [Marivirga sp.]|nr:hypothetical protein [Marivirga sp.]